MEPTPEHARQTASTAYCLDDAEIAELVEGQMAPAERARAETHIDGCAECRRLVAEIARGAPSVPGESSRASAVTTAVDLAAHDAAWAERAGFSFAPGETIAGKYRVEKLLGVGGMGAVVAATHVQLGRRVALKFMRSTLSGSPEAVARFLREARAVAQIESEHVARLLDFGTLATGEPFMVMELLRGIDFAAMLVSRGAATLEEAVDYVLQACEAVAEAHKLGIIHRDLKPANLFLASRVDGAPLVKVLDFGISKLTSAASLEPESSFTGSDARLGTPRYMSPEQLQSPKLAGARVDIWALGCVLYELLTATPAFSAETVHGVAVAIATAEPRRLCDVRPDLPPRIAEVILACLAKDPARRVPSIGALARMLAPFAPPRSRPSLDRIARLDTDAAMPVDSGVSHDLSVASTREPSFGAGGRARRRGAVLIALVALSGVCFAFYGRPPSNPPLAQSVRPGPELLPPRAPSSAVEVPVAAEPPVAASSAVLAAPRVPSTRPPARGTKATRVQGAASAARPTPSFPSQRDRIE